MLPPASYGPGASFAKLPAPDKTRTFAGPMRGWRLWRWYEHIASSAQGLNELRGGRIGLYHAA
jgi:hypothetical protein